MTAQRGVLGWVLLSIAISASAGCGDKKAEKCKSGEVHECVCPNKRASLQSCAPDGSWAACMCGSVATTAGMMAESGTTAAGTMAGGGGMSGTGAGTTAGTDTLDASVADAMPMDGDVSGDGAAPGQDAAVPEPAYSSCKAGQACPMGEMCDATAKFCAAECTTMTECPDAPDGNATKACTLGRCTLSCTTAPTATMCPTGMGCTAGFPFPNTCAF